MIETVALGPHLGVEVAGVDNPLDGTLIARCLEPLTWRDVLRGREIFTVASRSWA